MTWAKLDDEFPDHPKIIGLTDAGFRLHVTAIAWSNRHSTDGLLPRKAIPVLYGPGEGRPDLRGVVEELLEARLWDRNGDAFVIHDFLDYNPSRGDVVQKRELRSEAGRRGGIASGITRGGTKAEAKTKQTLKQKRSKAEAKSNPDPDPDPLPDPEPVPGRETTASPKSPPGSPKPKAQASRGTRLRPDWVPTDALRAWAEHRGLTDEGLEKTLEVFRDYWVAQPGAKGVKLDWDATLRNWIRRDLSGTTGRRDPEARMRRAREFIDGGAKPATEGAHDNGE